MFSNTILLSVLIIIAISIFVMILNRRTSDRCLKDFSGFLTTLYDKKGKRLWGRLVVYTTGLEFRYRSEHHDDDSHVESSFILYKQEFNNMWIIFRFHDELSPENQAKRRKQLQKSFHPRLHRRMGRGIRNLAVNLKDSFVEITGTVLSAISTSSPMGKALSSQQKQVTKAQTELAGYAGTAYDPILERHIGQRVVLEITNPSNVVEEHVGILKEYSSEFLEVMGLNFKDGDRIRECDMIVPRAHSFIRHSNEPVKIKVKKGGNRKIKEKSKGAMSGAA